MEEGERTARTEALGSAAGAASGTALDRDFEALMAYVMGHEEELAELGCNSLGACLLTGKATKKRAGNAEREKHYKIYCRIKDMLSAGQRRRWEDVEGRTCTAMSEAGGKYKEKVERSIRFLGSNRDRLIALQKSTLTGIAYAAEGKKDSEWKFFAHFMEREVSQGKLSEDLKQQLFSWETILCAPEGLSLQTSFEKAIGRVCAFFEKNQEILIALQKPHLMAIANSAEANKDSEWNFFRNFMQRVVAEGKLSEDLKQQLFCWESILCAPEGLSLQTSFEKAIARTCAFFEKKQETLIALQKPNLMGIANSAQANKDSEWNFFRHFMQRVVAEGKLSEDLMQQLFCWESILCAPEGLSLQTSFEKVVVKFIAMIESKQEMLRGLKVATAKELFAVHAMKEDAALRFGYDFVTRIYPKLGSGQQHRVEAALSSVLVSKAQMPVKSAYAAKLHANESCLGEDLPRPRLPKSLRQLYGNSMEAETRTMTFFHRVNEVDEFMNSLQFEDCVYCHEGWFGSRRTKKELPGQFECEVYRKTNFLRAAESQWLEPGRPICKNCLAEAKARSAEGVEKLPFRLTADNYAYPGKTLKETDALSFFEEEILSPIQHIVRIFTLHATGQCELRGHVGNLFQNGPQYVRQIPAVVGDMKMLLIRRCPKDASRKQRLPFLVSRLRLERALDRLCKPRAAGGSLALQPGALTPEGYLGLVCRENLEQFSPTEEGAEPEGLPVAVVEQEPWERIEYKLFAMWMSCSLSLQMAAQVRLLHEPEEEVDAAEKVQATWRNLRASMLETLQEEPGRHGDLKLSLVAAYLRSRGAAGSRVEDVEAVLHDELTAVQEVASWKEPLVEEGLWTPEDLAGQQTEQDLKEDLWDAVCEANSSGGSKSTIHRFGAAHRQGYPILDPPVVQSRNQLIREDQPYYIAAGFVKLFPLGEGDYWAHKHERVAAGQDLPFWEWLKHLLLLADGRFQAHPRFYFFALNTALRNKALRGRSYLLRRTGGANANVAHTNEELFAMGKSNFTRLVTAFEHSLVGSAQEKIQQRSDLEAMVEQLEQMTLEQRAKELAAVCRRARDVHERLLDNGGDGSSGGRVGLALHRAEEVVRRVLGYGWVFGDDEQLETGQEATLCGGSFASAGGGREKGVGSAMLIGVPHNAKQQYVGKFAAEKESPVASAGSGDQQYVGMFAAEKESSVASAGGGDVGGGFVGALVGVPDNAVPLGRSLGGEKESPVASAGGGDEQHGEIVAEKESPVASAGSGDQQYVGMFAAEKGSSVASAGGGDLGGGFVGALVGVPDNAVPLGRRSLGGEKESSVASAGGGDEQHGEIVAEKEWPVASAGGGDQQYVGTFVVEKQPSVASAGGGGVAGGMGASLSSAGGGGVLAGGVGVSEHREEEEDVRELVEELEARCDRLEAGGEIPCHFTTLTTAIYHWDDLRLCLEKYEVACKERREGRLDPAEPSEREVSEHKRRVLRWPGVVAWFTAYKMELFYRYVLSYEDGEGVFEWGAGGIMHLHSINFGSQMPRVDPNASGLHVAEPWHAQMGAEFAAVHEEYLTDWSLGKVEKWSFQVTDEAAARKRDNPSPVHTDSESDGSETNEEMVKAFTFPPVRKSKNLDGGLTGEEWALNPDTDFVRIFPTPTSMQYALTSAGMREQVVLTSEQRQTLQELEAQLVSESWHPCQITVEQKKLLMLNNSQLVRRARRKWYRRLTEKCNMHDRHGGAGVDIAPVLVEIEEEDAPAQSGSTLVSGGGEHGAVLMRVVTQNMRLREADEGFRENLGEQMWDVLCLQEVTPSCVQSLLEAGRQHDFEVVSPLFRGRHSAEGFDVAMLLKKHFFRKLRVSIEELGGSGRCLLHVEVQVVQNGALVAIATAHLSASAEERVHGPLGFGRGSSRCHGFGWGSQHAQAGGSAVST